MIATISRPDFASGIISRYTSGTLGQLPGVDLLFMRAREETGDGSPLARSIQHIYLINRAITENTVLNLNIHLDFLYSVFSKTVRELHQSAARHIAMLDKKAAATRKAPYAVRPSRPVPNFSPYPLYSDGTNRLPALEVRPSRADTTPLTHTGAPGQEVGSAGNIESHPKSGRKGTGFHDTISERAMQPATKAQRAEAYARGAGSDVFLLKQELLPGGSTGPDKLLLRQHVFSVLPGANQNMLSWLRELWQIELAKGVDGRNSFVPLTQIWWKNMAAGRTSEWTRASRMLPIPVDKITAFHQGRLREAARDDGNDMRLAVISPKIPRLSPITTAAATDAEQTGTPHTISRTHPTPVQLAAQTQSGEGQNAQMPVKREGLGDFLSKKENAQLQSPVYGRFPTIPNTALNAQPDMDYTGQIAPARIENPRRGEVSERPEQSTIMDNRTSIADHARAPRRASASDRSRYIMRTPQTVRQPADANRNAESGLPLKVLPYGLVPRKGSEATVKESNQLTGIMEHASIRQIPGKTNDFPTPAHPFWAFPPARDIVGGMGHDFSDRKSAANLNSLSLIPPSLARSVGLTASISHFSAARLAIPQASAYTASGQTGTSAAMIHSQPPLKSKAQIDMPAVSVPGAAIVYRKESPVRLDRPPVPLKVDQDIEFIKKTVKQSSASTRTPKTNIAINLPGSGANANPRREADALYDIDRQVNAIADKVYGALERRLRSEQMRKGLL